MRIAVLAPLEFPICEPFAGGLEKHTDQLVRGLAARGHSVTLFARAGSQVQGQRISLRPQSNRDYREVLRQIRSGSFDLLHNNTVHYLPVLLSRWLPFPVVTTLHTPPYRKLSLGVLVARLSSGSRFVAISDFLANQWHRYLGKFPVIHNGIDPGDWPFSANSVKKTAFWYGRLTPEKGAEYAINAARKAGYRLELAGPLYDADYYHHQIEPLLGADVAYLGHLNQTEIAARLGKASVGLFTSVWDEPFGLVLTEMLACGTPVAGFRSGAATEIIDIDTGILVEKRDVPSLTSAIVTAAGYQRELCRQKVLQMFTESKMLDAYEGLYTVILDK